jgi:hypothetical protein
LKLDNLITKLHSIFSYKFISQLQNNFEDIKAWANNSNIVFNKHLTTQKDAHTTKQIKHTTKKGQDVDLSNHENFQDELIEHLVLGHNGDGNNELKASHTSMDAQSFDSLHQRLYHDFLRESNAREELRADLTKKIQRIVNVDDFGGDPTGKKDSTKAFQDAFGNGNVMVTMSAGIYLTTGIKMPDNSRLVGQGKGITTIKFTDDAPREAIGITNLRMSGTANNISLEDFSFDGNKEVRFPNEIHDYRGANYDYATPSGGSLSSNIRFAGVKRGFIKNVETYDALLHGIDITMASDRYYDEGDGNRPPSSLESEYIWIDNCESYGHGDDGITTHWCKYVFITNCYSHEPKAYHGNSNGIEVDDGSRYVYLNGNTTYHNHCGIEIKAHANTCAPSNVMVDGHISKEDTRAYVLRHIGHHRLNDPISLTAYNVTLNNCMAITPFPNETYKGWTSRALSISAYKNVSVTNFVAQGDGRYSKGNPVVVAQFKSENISLNGINITGFNNSSADIRVLGSDNRGQNYSINNANIFQSSNTAGIQDGGRVYTTKITNCNIKGNGTGTGIKTVNTKAQMYGNSVSNYSNNTIVNKTTYNDTPTRFTGGAILASGSGNSLARKSAVIASTGGSTAYDDRTFLIGSSVKSKARGSRSGAIGSSNSETIPGKHSQLILASKKVKSKDSFTVLGGYAEKGNPSHSNVKFELNSFNGNATFAGKITQNNADIAELFESQSGLAIDLGTIVTLDDDKIRKAQPSDVPIGVISGTAALVANEKTYHHKDKFLKNEYGVTITERKQIENIDDNGESYFEWRDIPVENPEYDSEIDYVSRSDRPEWNTVGLLGQIYTNVEKDVVAGDYINGRAGIGFKDNLNGKGRVMKITSEYSEERGCAIALVLWGVK